MVIGSVIVSTFEFHQLIGMDHEAVFIVEILTDRTMVDHHFAVCTEGIIAGGNHTIGINGRHMHGNILGNTGKLLKAAADTAHVVGAVNLINTGLGLAANHDIVIALDLIQAICDGSILVNCAVLTKDIPESRSIGVVLNEADTGVHIGVSAEVIGLAVHFDPHTAVEAGAVAVSGTVVVDSPGTLGGTVRTEDIGNAVDALFADIQLVVSTCIAVTLVCGLPAGLQHIVNGVVQIAVHFKNAGAGLVDLAAAFVLADELAVNDLVIVLQLLQRRAPIHHRLTGLTIGSVLITVRSQSGSQILNRQFCIMHVVGGRNAYQLRCNVNAATEGDTVNGTVNDLAVDIDGRLVAAADFGIILFRQIVIAVVGPDTDRDAHNRLSGGSCLGRIHCIDTDGQQFGYFVVREACIEAVGNHCALGFPGVCSLQLQGCNQLLQIGRFGNIDVHIVDGLCLCGSAGVVMTGQGYRSLTGNGKGSGDLHGIAQLILYLKADGMGTGNQGNVFLGGKHTAADGSLGLYAIHKNLTGGDIESHIIRHRCGEGNLVAVDNGAIIQGNRRIRGRIGRCGNGGQHSVIHSRAVVQGDVIDVEGHRIGNLRLCIRTDERRGHGMRGIRCNGRAYIIVSGDVNGCIYPAGFRNIRIGCRVQVCLLTGCRRGKHHVLSQACEGTIGILYPQEHLEGETGSAAGGEGILGNIYPHTEGGCLLAVGYVTQNNRLFNAVKIIVGPCFKIGIGIVESPCQSVLAVSDLTAVGRSAHKGRCSRKGVHLAVVGIGRIKQVVLNTILQAPFLCLRIAYEAGSVAILEVNDDFGTLAECDGKNQFRLTVNNGHIHAFHRSILCGSELKTIQRAGVLIGKGHRNRIGIHIHGILTDRGHDGQRDGTDIGCSRIRNNGRSNSKLEDFRVRNADGLAADNIAAGNNLDLHIALGTVGNKLSVSDGTKGIIRKYPNGIRRHLHSITMGIDCFRTEGILRLGRKDIVLGLNVYIVQNAGGADIGGNKDAVGGGTLCTIAGHGTHGEVILANTLGQEGGRTAAVAVGCPLAAQGQHGFAFFKVAEANRVVGAAAIIHTDDQGTVFLNTNHGTCGRCGSTFFRLFHKLAILYDHAERHTDRMEQSAGSEVCVKVISVKRLNITGNGTVRFFENIQNRTGRRGFTLDAEILAVVNQNTGRISIIVQVRVHTTDNVVSQVLLIILCHFGQFLMRPVCLLGHILVDLMISGNDGYIGIGGIHLDNMDDLSAVAIGIVQDHLIFVCSTGYQNVILSGDHIIVTVQAKLLAVIDDFIFTIFRSSIDSRFRCIVDFGFCFGLRSRLRLGLCFRLRSRFRRCFGCSFRCSFGCSFRRCLCSSFGRCFRSCFGRCFRCRFGYICYRFCFGFRCKCRNRNIAQQQRNRQQHGNYALCNFVRHVNVSLA